MIVVDASVIARLALRNEEAELAGAVCAADPEWAAPVLWRSEFREALAQCVQRAGMSLAEALQAWRMAEELVGGREYQVASDRVLELAKRSRRTGYECEYVALARDLGVPLVTADRQLSRAFPGTAVLMADFVRNSVE